MDEQGRLSDDELVGRAQRAGPESRAALAELLRRHQDNVYGLCLRLLGEPGWAEDVAQDALVLVLKGLDRFDGRSQLSTWIYRITTNACLTELRRMKTRRRSGPRSEADMDTFIAPNRDSASESGELSRGSRVETSETHTRLLAALDGLSDEHRTILVLRDVQGLEYEQIAEALDIAIGTVRSRLFRARRALRNEMDAQEMLGRDEGNAHAD